MRIMALNAIHFVFEHRVMLRQAELGVRLEVAIETRRRVFAGIDNKFPASTTESDMFAAGTVTRFTPGQPFHLRPLEMEAGVRARREHSSDVGVTLVTGLVANKTCAFNHRRRKHGPLQAGAGDQNHAAQNRNRKSDQRKQVTKEFHTHRHSRRHRRTDAGPELA